jgi:uncharacterized protein
MTLQSRFDQSDEIMKIWVDADACPNGVKKVLFKVAERIKKPVILVANHVLHIPSSRYVSFKQVAKGFDVADNQIVADIECGDVLITNDIPLASDAIAQEAYVLNMRGECYDKNNIAQRLQHRNLMETLRNAGQLEQGGGPPPLGAKDQREFANALDRLLAKII